MLHNHMKSHSKERIFVLAWDFHPNESGESIQASKTLYKSSLDYDIIAHSNRYLKEEYINGCNIIYVSGGYINYIMFAIKKFKQLNRIYNYKYLHSRSMPLIGHVTGFLIKLIKPSLVWVSYFSDPPWKSPYTQKISDYIRKRDYFYERIMMIFSLFAILISDKCVFNNISLRDYVLNKGLSRFKDKSIIAPYGIESNTVIDSDLSEENVLKITHVGSIYGIRNFDTVLKFLDEVSQNNISLYDRIIIEQVGFIQKDMLLEIKNCKHSSKFVFIDTVPYSVSLNYMKNSDVLLSIDGFVENQSNIFISSKVLEYLRFNNPIVGITTNSGPTYEILKVTNNYICNYNEIELMNIITGIVNAKNNGIHHSHNIPYELTLDYAVDIFDSIFYEN